MTWSNIFESNILTDYLNYYKHFFEKFLSAKCPLLDRSNMSNQKHTRSGLFVGLTDKPIFQNKCIFNKYSKNSNVWLIYVCLFSVRHHILHHILKRWILSQGLLPKLLVMSQITLVGPPIKMRYSVNTGKLSPLGRWM